MVLSNLSHLQSGGGENKCVTNTLSVYILVSHLSSTNVVIILNKNIHYCLFSWYFTSLWQDFIQTLDEPMVHKLCVRSLQCGLGSMDYIHSMLIMEDDNDSDTESEHFDVYSETPQESESTDSQHASAVTGPAPNPSAASNSLPCCKCSVCIVVVREDVLQHLQSSASFVWTQMCWSFVLENDGGSQQSRVAFIQRHLPHNNISICFSHVKNLHHHHWNVLKLFLDCDNFHVPIFCSLIVLSGYYPLSCFCCCCFKVHMEIPINGCKLFACFVNFVTVTQVW